MRRSEVALEPVRLALALAHCLPDCQVELTASDGERLCIGFGGDSEMTPCDACPAVAAAMRSTARKLGPLLGLAPGCPRARMLDDDISDSHVGLGVYRYRGTDAWGYVFATLLETAHVRPKIEAASADLLLDGTALGRRAVRVGSWQLLADPRLRVTVCCSRYACDEAALVEEAETLALEIAGRCVVDEVVADP